MENKFTWLPFYKELSDWLLGKQNSQPELISKLKEIGITGFRDGTEKGKEITLQEIDPFTFLSYLNKFHSDERRVEILQDLRHKLHFRCPEPTDVSEISKSVFSASSLPVLAANPVGRKIINLSVQEVSKGNK